MLLVFMLTYASAIVGGGACSSDGNKVKSLAKRYSSSHAVVRTSEEEQSYFRERRRREINQIVENAPLGTLYMLRRTLDDAYLDRFSIDATEKKIFQDAVIRRYDLNRDAIDKVVAESIEKWRRHNLTATARLKMANRRRRIAWRAGDSFHAQTLKIILEPVESKEEKKTP